MTTHKHAKVIFSVLLTSLFLPVAVLAVPNDLHKMHNALSGKTQHINMGEQNESKQTGTAVEGGVWVKVSVLHEPAGGSEPVHIHTGTCAKLNPVPWKPLSPIVNGTSITTLKGVTIDQLKAAHYAINAHESASNLKKYVSCGDLK